MIAHKHITKIAVVFMAILLGLCLAAAAFSDVLLETVGGTGVTMEYESVLFDTSKPINVNIIMDDAQWEEMLDNAMNEQYYQCDVEINGQTFYRVGIRPKGNTSLSSIVSNPDTDRFSLKLEFDQYIEGQTCYGLDKLILNNNYADATSMKEALVYDMFQYLGADASLYNYAKISLNGEYWGVYLALEAVEDSFLLRNYGVQSGELYKPDSMRIGGGDFNPDSMDFGNPMPPDLHNADTHNLTGRYLFDGNIPDGAPDDWDFDVSDISDMFEGFSPGTGGSDLNYIDDDLDSYSTIWNSGVTNAGKSDHRRVVTALRKISEGSDLERYMDIDNLLKYMAVHVFSVNQDSLSGMMAHNYYLYEYEGRLNLLPWDYNLAFGGMDGNDAAGVVNSAIDTPWNGTNFFDSLMEDETYLERYHAYLRQLVDEYVNGGAFDEFYERTRSQLDTLVANDPTAFYSYDEYLAAAEMLYKTVELRGQSIAGQLDGDIPSADSSQRAASPALIDASSLDISVMGSMDMGGGDSSWEGFGFKDREDDSGQNSGNPSGTTVSGTGSHDPKSGTQTFPAAGADRKNGDMPPQMEFTDRRSSTMVGNLIVYGICFVILLAALIFAVLFPGKKRRR